MRFRITLFVSIWMFALAPLAPGAQEESAGGDPAQDEEQELGGIQSFALRVTGRRPGGLVVVDRGSNAAVTIGDPVRFHPARGGMYAGTVVEVGDRTSVVELNDSTIELEITTKGEVLIPRERIAAMTDLGPGPEVEGPERPPWEVDEWEPGTPLLGKVEAVRPEVRGSRMNGRVYLIGDGIWTSEDDREDKFFRLGTDVEYSNPFGRGGGIHFDGEVNLKDYESPDGYRDQDDTDFRLDRLSYYEGGTRFTPNRWEAGRFLQYGIPEFGVLDGVEYERRLGSGHRFGTSIGVMPEPDEDYETGDDLQIAAYYRWILDDRERFSAAAGYQKSFHNGDSDRDLIVGKVQYLPMVGWNYHATAWVDYYTDSDDVKGDGFDLTQLYATAGHRWESGNGLDVTFRHIEFPEIDRNEFHPIVANDLEDDRKDRLSMHGWRWIAPGRRFHIRLGVWDDEDEDGGDASVSLDLKDLLWERSRTDVTLFTATGLFTNVVGSRLSISKYVDSGAWSGFYEYSKHELDDFNVNADEFTQHRLRLSRDFHLESGWDMSFYAETLLWDNGTDEDAWSAGVFLQRSF